MQSDQHQFHRSRTFGFPEFVVAVTLVLVVSGIFGVFMPVVHNSLDVGAIFQIIVSIAAIVIGLLMLRRQFSEQRRIAYLQTNYDQLALAAAELLGAAEQMKFGARSVYSVASKGVFAIPENFDEFIAMIQGEFEKTMAMRIAIKKWKLFGGVDEIESMAKIVSDGFVLFKDEIYKGVREAMDSKDIESAIAKTEAKQLLANAEAQVGDLENRLLDEMNEKRSALRFMIKDSM